MLDFYPENICNFEMEAAWKKAPVVFEACWHMNDWYLQGWDIDYIVEESLKWHISSFNSKGTIVPEAGKESVKRWLNKMGYRFELRKLTYNPMVKKGDVFRIRGLWANTGVAPIYHRYPLVVRLKNGKEVISFTSRTDIRSWLPDMDILWEEEFDLEGKAGEYSLEI
ncbi:DUF4832 domain-containing protein, partial [Clostridioides difficile]|uniref:DUF4832 domain-containing protein n=1 Tax=Clostridioides difficile TaxID=1496 RepID=UPI0023581247